MPQEAGRTHAAQTDWQLQLSEELMRVLGNCRLLNQLLENAEPWRASRSALYSH